MSEYLSFVFSSLYINTIYKYIKLYIWNSQMNRKWFLAPIKPCSTVNKMSLEPEPEPELELELDPELVRGEVSGGRYCSISVCICWRPLPWRMILVTFKTLSSRRGVMWTWYHEGRRVRVPPPHRLLRYWSETETPLISSWYLSFILPRGHQSTYYPRPLPPLCPHSKQV